MSDFQGPDTRATYPPSDPDADVLAIFRRQWVAVLVCAMLGFLAAWLYSAVQPATYEASSSLLLVAAGDEQSPATGRARTLDVDTWATVARSTSLLQEVADDLEVGTSSVRSRTSAVPAPTGDILILAFEAGTADDAVRGASVYNERFLESRRDTVTAASIERARRLEAISEELRSQVDAISVRISQEEAKGELASNSQLAVLSATQRLAIERLGAVTAELGSIDTSPEVGRVIIEPQTTVALTGLANRVILLSGLMVGGLIGLFVALLRDRRDDRYKTRASAGLRTMEVGRVPYVASRQLKDGTPEVRAYDRVIAKLTFARQRQSERNRYILLLPVESVTMPEDAATSIASALVDRGVAAGISIVTRSVASSGWAEPPRESKSSSSVRGHLLTLVPARALDLDAVGIGLAIRADETLLIVSEKTLGVDLRSALEDLHGMGVDDVRILVVKGGRSSVAAGWRSLDQQRRRHDQFDAELAGESGERGSHGKQPGPVEQRSSS